MLREEALDVLHGLVLDDGRRWGEAATEWQRADAEAVLTPDEGPNQHLQTRPKGGSKSTDLAGTTIAWLVTQAAPMVEGYAVAADQDQANRLLDRARGFVARTPGLSSVVQVESRRIVGPEGARVVALAADVAGSEGLLSPWFAVDELPNWADTATARGMWTSVVSAVPKWPGCRLTVIGHAGDPGHWSYPVLQRARVSSLWRVSEVPGPLPWIDAEQLEEQRALLLPSQFARRHLNVWTAAEDRLSTREAVEACVRHEGVLPFEQGVGPYVLALDIGLKNDRTVLTVAHLERYDDATEVVVDRIEVWQGSPTDPVALAEVEAVLVEAWHAYGRPTLTMDPWQGAQLAQRLRACGVRVVEFTFSQTSIGRLALTLWRLLRDRLLDLPDDAELVDELANVQLRETQPGIYRMDHASGRHDDRAVSLALAAHHLLTAPAPRRRAIVSSSWAGVEA